MTPPLQALADQARLLRLALQYFTRLPRVGGAGFSRDQLDRSMRYLPLAGALIGAAMAIVYLIAARVWPTPVAAALVVAFGVALTGGLHEDGLADFCDAFFTQRDRDGVLAIMKDPRLGSYGVLGLTLALLIRYSVLLALPRGVAPFALIAAQAFSRLMALCAMQRLNYVRADENSNKPTGARLGGAGSAIAALCGLLPLVALGWRALIGALAACCVALLLGWTCQRRIGGYTGDCLGAIQQATELTFYLGLLAS